MQMRYRFLGPSGLRVSELALGTMTFGEAWSFGSGFDECRRIFERYAEAGGNFIDTANNYQGGEAERMVGKLVSDERDRWVIATKYTISTRSGDPNAAGNHRKNLVQSVEGSLARLGTDYVDLLWMHAWDEVTPAAEVMRALDDLVRAGKVRYVGVSDSPAWYVAHANTLAELRGWTPFVALQIEYSLIERTSERELLPMARAFGLTVTPWGALGMGALTGKFTRGGDNDSKRGGMATRRLSERNLGIARVVDAVADEVGRSSTEVAVAWLRHQGRDVLPIVGARLASQLDGWLGALDLTLPPAQLARLDEASAIDMGFPRAFLDSTRGLVLGDTADRLERR
jgi:aryl-alcohol dehydrogenase-like predicted oxidoreductase